MSFFPYLARFRIYLSRVPAAYKPTPCRAYGGLVILLLMAFGARADETPGDVKPRPLDIHRNSAITPATLGPKFLRMLKKTMAVNEVSKAVLEREMGIRMSPHPNWPGRTYYQGAVGDGRRYTFIYGPLAGKNVVWLVIAEDENAGEVTSCLLPFDKLHRELTGMGFGGVRRNGEHAHAPRNGWKYVRSGIELKVDYDPRRSIRRGEDLVAKNLCIESIQINGEER